MGLVEIISAVGAARKAIEALVRQAEVERDAGTITDREFAQVKARATFSDWQFDDIVRNARERLAASAIEPKPSIVDAPAPAPAKHGVDGGEGRAFQPKPVELPDPDDAG